MSLRIYHTASELTGSDISRRKAGRFKLLIGYRNQANGKRRVKVCEFTVCGESDAAVDAHAVRTVELIGDGINGQILGLHKIMGHYRRDQPCPIIPSNRSMYGIIGHTASEDGNEKTNLKLFIPFWNGSQAQAENLLAVGTYSSSDAQIGCVRWHEQDEATLEAFYAGTFRGYQAKLMDRVSSEELVEDNVSDGITDGVLDKDSSA